MLPSLGPLWRFARRVDDLFALQRKTEDAFEAVERRLRELEERVARLDSEQARLVTEARSAATAAGTMVAGAVISEAVTRLTRLEDRVNQVEHKSLPPPLQTDE